MFSLGLAVAESSAARATEAASATSIPTGFCKTPTTRPALAPGFVLLCGKRMPAGVFLGSFLSPAADPIDDCVKRCTSDKECKAFSLDGRDLPNGRVCTLFGSQEGATDATAWISGFRVPNNDMSRAGEIVSRYGARSGSTAASPPATRPPTAAPPSAPVTTAKPTPTPAPTAGAGGGGTTHYHRYARKAPSWSSTTGSKARPPAAASDNEPPPERPPTSAEARPPAAPPAAPPIANTVSAQVDTSTLQPVYFATDRTPGAPGAPLEVSFVAGWTPTISYGLTLVNIPKTHKIGQVERPKFNYFLWRYQAATDADDFRIKALKPLDRATFVKDLQAGPDSVLLFVHGYNVKFADAVFKAAQIAYDSNFPGSVLVFSWPSAGEVIMYDQDQTNAQAAVPHLAEIFRLVSNEIGKKNVYIVAHSMGNQVLVNALVQSALSNANISLNELVMAAPDVPLNVFQSELDQIRAVATNITLYASSADKALLVSMEKSQMPRLGFVGRTGPNIFPGIDTIDVTAVGDDMLGLDHSTFSTSRAVIDDLGRLIRSPTHLKPDMRTPELRLMTEQANLQYWLYPR